MLRYAGQHAEAANVGAVAGERGQGRRLEIRVMIDAAVSSGKRERLDARPSLRNLLDIDGGIWYEGPGERR